MFSKDEDEVNDLFQEILIRLWQGLDSFEGKSDIKTWIYRVSLNFCLNYDKKQKRAGERVDLDMDIKPYDVNTEFVGLVEAIDGSGQLGAQLFSFRVLKQ